MQARETLQDAGFAGAIGAKNGNQLTRIDHQVDLVDHRCGAIVQH